MFQLHDFKLRTKRKSAFSTLYIMEFAFFISYFLFGRVPWNCKIHQWSTLWSLLTNKIGIRACLAHGPHQGRRGRGCFLTLASLSLLQPSPG